MQSLEKLKQFISLWNRLSLEKLLATVLQYLLSDQLHKFQNTL